MDKIKQAFEDFYKDDNRYPSPLNGSKYIARACFLSGHAACKAEYEGRSCMHCKWIDSCGESAKNLANVVGCILINFHCNYYEPKQAEGR
jgi:hypothetical protein